MAQKTAGVTDSQTELFEGTLSEHRRRRWSGWLRGKLIAHNGQLTDNEEQWCDDGWVPATAVEVPA